MSKDKVKKEKGKQAKVLAKKVEVVMKWVKEGDEKEVDRQSVTGVRIVSTDGKIIQLEYNLPIPFSTFLFAITDLYFVYRPEYPSYRYLRYIPMRHISYIDAQFADVEEKKPEEADELALAT